MTTKFMVNGEEKTVIMLGSNNIDWSADFIGNTNHGMKHDDEGRYIASQEEYDWWENMIAEWQHMESVIEDCKEANDPEEVQQVVNDTMGGFDLEDQPRNVIEALKETFGSI